MRVYGEVQTEGNVNGRSKGGESEEVKVDRISSFVVTFVVLHRLTWDHVSGAGYSYLQRGVDNTPNL